MNEITIGVLGAGYWGPNLIRNFAGLPGVRLAGIVDADPARLAQVARSYPAVPTGPEPMLVFGPGIDAVVIATSAKSHYDLARRALEAGKHLFVEKPLALTVAEAEDLVARAREHRRILMVGHLLLYHPAVRLMRDYLVRGEIGELRYAYSTRVNLGRVRTDENALWSLCPHDIAVIGFLFGAAPERVFAAGASFLSPGIPDVVFMTLYFPEGRLAHVHASWLDPHRIRKLTLVGSRKMVVFDDAESQEKIRVYDKGVDTVGFASYPESFTLRFGDIHIPRLSGDEPLRLECAHFIDCIRDGRTPLSDGANGLAVVRILAAADRSLQTGAIVTL